MPTEDSAIVEPQGAIGPRHNMPLVRWVGFLPPDKLTGQVGLIFVAPDGQKLRFQMTLKDAAVVSDSLSEALQPNYRELMRAEHQAFMSSLRPSLEGLVVPGQSHVPSTKCSSASAGEL